MRNLEVKALFSAKFDDKNLDRFFGITVFIGQFFYPIISVWFFLILLKSRSIKIKYDPIFLKLFLVFIIGFIIVLSRPIEQNLNIISRFIFLWFVPFLVALFAPKENTVRQIEKSIRLLFYIDFFVNITSIFIGHDLFNRAGGDLREGMFLPFRLGGLLGNSFASGVFTLAYSFTLLFNNSDKKIYFLLPFLNFILVGSWRFVFIIFIFIFYYLWKKRDRLIEYASIFMFSIIVIFSTYITSSFSGFNSFVNKANDFRIYAWIVSTNKIAESPLWGFGYTNEKLLESVDELSIDEYNVAESWYLGNILNFGLLYFFFRFLTFLQVYKKLTRTKSGSVFMPIFFIDLTYGGIFESYILYIYLWVIYFSTNQEV